VIDEQEGIAEGSVREPVGSGGLVPHYCSRMLHSGPLMESWRVRKVHSSLGAATARS
jgi:hypothetical protein